MPEWRLVIVIPRSDTLAFTRQSCVICLLVECFRSSRVLSAVRVPIIERRGMLFFASGLVLLLTKTLHGRKVGIDLILPVGCPDIIRLSPADHAAIDQSRGGC